MAGEERAGFPVGIVGESFYQPAIAKCNVGDPVRLQPEPNNPHDPRAIAVLSVYGETIGHVPKDNFLQRAIHDEKQEVDATILRIGNGKKGNEGVVLDVELLGRHGEGSADGPPILIMPADEKLDYGALARFHELRGKTRSYVSATRPIEVADPEVALQRYRDALVMTVEYCSIPDTGDKGWRLFGDTEAIDRLAIVLTRYGRFEELAAEIDAFLMKFPGRRGPDARLSNLLNQVREIIAGNARAPRPSKPKAPSQGKVDKSELSRLLKNARRAKDFNGWVAAIKLCRTAKDDLNEKRVLAEFLQRPAYNGRTWFDYEERYFELESRFLAVAAM